MGGLTAYAMKKNIKVTVRAMARLMDVDCMSDARSQIHAVELSEHDSEYEEAQEKRPKKENKEHIKELKAAAKESNVIICNNKDVLAYCTPAWHSKKLSIKFVMLVQFLTMFVSSITI